MKYRTLVLALLVGGVSVLGCLPVRSQSVMTDSIHHLDEVVVTGTGTEHLLKNDPVQTEVISGKMLRNFSGKSLQDMLSMLTASFDFNEDDMGSQMQMNGLGNNYILILINGKRIHGDVGGENDLSLIDPNNIEKIEIVKGASSALYGSDAIAGVVNIITKKHDQEGLLLENTTRVGSYGDVRQHNGFGFNVGTVSSYTNFQLQHTDGWQNTASEDPHQTEFPITDSHNKTVNRRTNWQVAERLSWTPVRSLEIYAEGSYQWKKIYRPLGIHPGVDIHWYDLKYHNASAALGGKWKLNPQDFLTVDITWNKHAYYYDFTQEYLTDGYIDGHFTNFYPYYPGDQQLQSDQQRLMAEAKGVFTLPYENHLSAGLEYRYDYLKAPMRVEKGTASDNHEAVYVQDEFTLLKPLNVTAGLRLNHNEQFGFRLTPKISGMLTLGQAVRLRATWSQGFKTPTPKELFYRYIRQMSGTYLYLGNENLKPQTSNYFSVGGEYTWNGLSVTATAYYNKVKDMITLVTIPNKDAPAEYILQYDPVKTRQYQNVEDAKTYGVDLTARYTWREFSVGLGYSYLDTEANQYDTEHDVMRQVIIDGMAHHKGNVFATWNHPLEKMRNLGIGLYGRFSSKRYYQINGDGKGYQLWRLNTSYEFNARKFLIFSFPHSLNFKIEAGVDNIFNYVDKAYHGLHLGTTSPGTTLYASFTIRFAQGKKTNNKFKSNLNQRNNEDED